MGALIYDGTRHEIDDRVLAHLQLVIGTKFRRQESFFLHLDHNPALGYGRRIIWMHPLTSLSFEFHGSKTPALNREWLDALTAAANSARGLFITPEPRA